MTTPTDARGRRCFFISPIGEDGSDVRKHADQVLKHLVQKTLEPLGLRVQRADDDTDPGAITPRIIASILAADVVIVDLSGINPNVFYELAIAHGYRKPTVHLQRSDERTPFDVKDMRIVRYDVTDPDALETAREKLGKYAQYALKNPGKLVTPLSEGGRFQAVQQSTDPVAESNAQVLNELADLRRTVAHLSKSVLSRTSGGDSVASSPAQLVLDVLVRDGYVEPSLLAALGADDQLSQRARAAFEHLAHVMQERGRPDLFSSARGAPPAASSLRLPPTEQPR